MKERLILLTALLGCYHRKQGEQMARGCEPPPHVVRASVVTTIPDSGIVEGITYDAASRLPVGDGTIVFAPLNVVIYANAKGEFRSMRLVRAAADTTVIVRVLRVGFEQHRDTVQLRAGGGARLQIYLSASQVCLGEVTAGF